MHTKQLAAQLQRIRRRISDCTLPKNKEMKKTNLLVLLLLLLSLLLCLSALLAACTPDGEKPDDTGSKTPEVKLSVVSGGATGYKIIFGANAADAESKAALRLQRAFKDKLGAEIELSIDSIIPAAGYVESDKEIVVGSTNRTLDEAEAGTPFRTSDYKIGISGEKIYIIGGSPEATYAAVDTFISDILKSDTEGSFCFSSASAVVYRAEYRITSFTADGAELSDYTVLLSNRLPELILSKIDSLTAKIGSLYGIAPGTAYETDGKAFLIGTTDTYPEYASLMGDASSLFTVSDGKVVLLAESNYHLMKAIDQIMNDLEATEGAYTLSTGKNNCILEESSTLSSMSFNLYGTTDIEQRRGAVGTIIMKYLPDVLGIQEGKTEWLGYLNRQFSGIYASVGTGNSENGYTETYNNIYYNTAKFTLIEGGTFWLSDTPDVPGTKFSSSKRVRTATYAVLELKKDGSRILYVNTHLDNLSETPRLEQLEVLLGFIDKYDYPTVITGDFNSNMTSNVYRKITAGKTFTTHRVLLDSREVAAEAYKYGTYNGLKPGGTGILDYCFVSDGDFNVSLYRVNTELVNEVYPSDHNSVYIEYTLLK